MFRRHEFRGADDPTLSLRTGSAGLRIFERQTCIGLGSRRFQLLKFRTMALDPDHTAPAWARKATRIGEFLRYTRIENLPRIYHLLRGEISLIDPDGSSPSFLE